MAVSTEVRIAGQQLWLHPFRAIYWPAVGALLLADLHLGKAAHFRREGIAVPAAVSQENWDRLSSLLLDFRPKRVLLLGDLFHSDYNREWEDFQQLVELFRPIAFELIVGNHDLLPHNLYTDAGLIVHQEPLACAPFLLSHHPMEAVTEGWYNLAGHIHPCVYLQGNGRQRHRLPCFWFGKHQGVLPAFGAFTGMAAVRPKAEDEVFVLAGDEVIAV